MRMRLRLICSPFVYAYRVNTTAMHRHVWVVRVCVSVWDSHLCVHACMSVLCSELLRNTWAHTKLVTDSPTFWHVEISLVFDITPNSCKQENLINIPCSQNILSHNTLCSTKNTQLVLSNWWHGTHKMLQYSVQTRIMLQHSVLTSINATVQCINKC